ncbi:vacuolar sorting protein [Laccaria bicolor S238N-H82]|uniref:Vacuolar sorting protein n=1 Tax=Laccaria bicolor (strain S238N-H82 / ATCC MYA-4686) TaxID=486041 RepID=B0CY02_LACBS|nr:vacuolar sorting protein [Laccaria bicolor S238N-H82]EDR12808.1 vacuolar sorting protein [Laccaria bicolor S238N-H82]|eukprot:XP_001877072.1 vacuolar sorting protein [Laccaria bicolor S238N-H82]
MMSSESAIKTQARDFYRGRAKEFVELHDQVETSVTLLDSLESFLSTFQKDLTAVAGQISELQDRSKDIDGRLKSRRKIEKPLSNLLSDITVSPSLATLILDSNVGEPWIEAIDELERRLNSSKARARVKAARDLGEVTEGLRIVAATKIRAFFHTLFQPIRSSVTTNMQVIQTSILLKYQPLFAFLQRQAPNVAHELQRAYVGAARTYYETGFRRYVRSLGWIKARSLEKFETIVTSENEKDISTDLGRLQHAKIDGPGATLAYMADDKAHKEPVEALLRSLLLVFMDNATAEYTFVSTFFAVEPLFPPSPHTAELNNSTLTPASPDRGTFTDTRSNYGSEYGSKRQSLTPGLGGFADMDAIWKQVVDPVLEYCQAFIRSILEPLPPATPLLTMIRLTEDVGTEVQKRRCAPAETFIFGLRLQMWPVFQKAMTEHIEALKKLAEGTNYGYFGRTSTTTDVICKRYVVFFNSFVFLTIHEEETMIFSNLLRLRQELVKLVTRHTDRISDTVAKATAQTAIYEILLQGLSEGTQHTAHLKLQQEIAYWSYLGEEARRKVVSVGQSRQRR